MSRLVSRILLSIFLFPLAGIFYGLIIAAGATSIRGPSAELTLFIFAGVLTWAFVGTYWCMLWRSSEQWSSRRVTGTVLSFLAVAVAGIMAGACVCGMMPGRGNWSFGAFVGGWMAIVLWLVATVFLWRETAAERARRLKGATRLVITCPTCGYNLTGLTESRCPECGSQFTLDELVAMQPKAEVDIE